ncbi:MAG: glycosyltransferase family 4 protein [Sphingomonadaceae bacterium]|nr:glycosyltransferase family 4 protein [Sphingomonadaceae bacterium]
MRILTVSAFFPSHGGGVEIVAGELANALARRGHESRLTGAAFDIAPQDEAAIPVPITCTDPVERFAGLPMPLPSRAARQQLAEEIEAADALVIHDALYASSQLARRHADRLGKPWMLIQHIGAIPYNSAMLRLVLGVANRLVTRPMLERAPQAVFISDTVRRYFAGANWASSPHLLFNGVDIALFHPPATPRKAQPRPQLLFVGRFVEKKGLAVLREFAALRPDCDVLLAGGGPIDPAGWQLPNIHVLGRKSRAELAALYRQSDALLLPSVGEGFPLVVQEAMASGLPVFCGEETAAADPDASAFLHGIAIDLRDPGATALRLSEALDQAQLGIQQEAASYAARAYDWDRNAEWIEQRLAALGLAC